MPVKVEIRGNADLRKALRHFAPDLEKSLKKEIKAALLPVVKEARSFVPQESPMSGWAMTRHIYGRFPKFDHATIVKGITYKTTPSAINRNGFSSMASIQNRSAAGAIFEGAGRLNPQGQPWIGAKTGSKSNKYSKSSNPKAGKQFIENLPPLVSSLKGRGRLIYRAWANSLGKAEGATMKAIDTAVKQFEERQSQAPLKRVA